MPVIGIANGYDTVSSERIDGTLDLVLSRPVGKADILLGKFLGRAGAMAVPVVGGLVVGFSLVSFSFEAGVGLWLVFIGLTLLLLLAFQALAQTLSTVVSSNGTAILAAIGLWVLFVPFWGLVQAVASRGLDADPANLVLLNPAQLYTASVLDLLSPHLSQGPPGVLPSQQAGLPVDPVVGLVLLVAGLLAASLAIFLLQDET